ncbi:invasion associated locus B family protein [Roseicitreum antarcticum]|uniref:Invasion protein IalB, involved in pathogenesis n=1 Tax=Roseicitreum antarcticum TaxID=564137 RepID=A0A1H2U1D6_9RHOB|nr:invasion associated locus B family protein [Roseicitreum antarcticum]SDW50033.1 Invasion protein IalB, involved in pathogenesis [Roseicitreum antarcticum]
MKSISLLPLAMIVALALPLAAPLGAQETTPAAPATNEPEPGPSPNTLSLGEDLDAAEGPGTSYAGEVFNDWELVCFRDPDGEDPCQMYQLLRDQDGNSVAEISLFPLEDAGEAVAGATIVTPLETLLTAQLTMRVDDGANKRYPFTWCGVSGCVARVGFTAPEIEAFRRGGAATISIVPVAAPDQTVDLNMSLAGFTAAYSAAEASVAE